MKIETALDACNAVGWPGAIGLGLFVLSVVAIIIAALTHNYFCRRLSLTGKSE